MNNEKSYAYLTRLNPDFLIQLCEEGKITLTDLITTYYYGSSEITNYILNHPKKSELVYFDFLTNIINIYNNLIHLAEYNEDIDKNLSKFLNFLVDKCKII